jgi:NADPH:quinone reductase-like Zn-dependent oxidoreductase
MRDLILILTEIRVLIFRLDNLENKIRNRIENIKKFSYFQKEIDQLENSLRIIKISKTLLEILENRIILYLEVRELSIPLNSIIYEINDIRNIFSLPKELNQIIDKLMDFINNNKLNIKPHYIEQNSNIKNIIKQYIKNDALLRT